MIHRGYYSGWFGGGVCFRAEKGKPHKLYFDEISRLLVGPPVARTLICIQNITNNSCGLIFMSCQTRVVAVTAAWRARKGAKHDQLLSDWLNLSHSLTIGRKSFSL